MWFTWSFCASPSIYLGSSLVQGQWLLQWMRGEQFEGVCSLCVGFTTKIRAACSGMKQEYM